MASYTTFEREALERFLIMFDLGTLEHFEAITAGIENSNYFIRFAEHEQEFVLTITEDLNFDEVAFFNDLLDRLANGGLPVPQPQRTLDGMPSTTFKKKPTWLFNRLPGDHPEQPDSEHCFQIGEALAKIHQLSATAKYQRGNAYDSNWATEAFSSIETSLAAEDKDSLSSALQAYRDFSEALPRGIIHGDLFRDNTLFEADQLTGVIDFYHACDDYLVQDIAITINDWCCNQAADDEKRVSALLAGYESIRTLEPAETSALHTFREFAAMRFALTRLVGGRADNPIKNPSEFLGLLARLQSR